MFADDRIKIVDVKKDVLERCQTGIYVAQDGMSTKNTDPSRIDARFVSPDE
jgi:hypothetical protein